MTFLLDARPETAVGYTIRQRIRYDYTAPIADLCQRLVVVPPLQHGAQHRQRWQLSVTGATERVARASTDAFGNLLIDVVVPAVRSWVEFDVVTDVVATAGHGPHHWVPDQRFRDPTPLTAPDVLVGDLVCPERGETEPEAICHRVHAALAYEHGVTGVRTTAAEALALGRGVCQDFAHVMVAACRLAGIPARYVSGHLMGEGASHAWVEAFRRDPSSGSWVVEAWDPTHDRRAGEGYVTIATGRDYSDVAPMSGTFRGDGVQGTLTVEKAASATT
jgi:hypothetical protein